MSLQVETTKVEPDIVVAHLSGSMTLGETEELTSLVGDLLVRGEKKLSLGGIGPYAGHFGIRGNPERALPTPAAETTVTHPRRRSHGDERGFLG